MLNNMPKLCKICNEPFKPKYSTVEPTCSVKCTINYSKLLKAKKDAKNKKAIENGLKERRVEKLKSYLQDEINKLARMIDRKFDFGCIDCNMNVQGSGNGAHYKSVGGNDNIRYNLHNIHLARIHCNKDRNGHIKDYYKNLEVRYNKDYQNYLEYELPLIYKEMHFMKHELEAALKTTRSIIRAFNAFESKSPLQMRDLFNTMIGLYKIKYDTINKFNN